RAIDSLRLEKGYRYWSAEVTPEHTPLEAGLGFCVRLDKGDFVGREALVRQKAEGLTRKLACLTLADPTVVALGGGPILDDGRTIGRVTSGGYGYTIGASIAYGYVPVASAAPGTRLAVELFGESVAAVVSREPLYDPRGQKIRGGVCDADRNGRGPRRHARRSRDRRGDAGHPSVHDLRARSGRLVPAGLSLLAQQQPQPRSARGVPGRARGWRRRGGVRLGIRGDVRDPVSARAGRPRRGAPGRLPRHHAPAARDLLALEARHHVRRHDRPRRGARRHAAAHAPRLGGDAVEPPVEDHRHRGGRRDRAPRRRPLRLRQHDRDAGAP